jgi:hypothetical protein
MIRRSFGGPKHKHIFTKTTSSFAELQRLIGPYEYDDHYKVSITDMTAYMGPNQPEPSLPGEVQITNYDHDGDKIPF